MRGKEASRKLRGTLKGITPAYAGKSQCNSSCTAGKWDHPRVCGEKPRQDSVGALEGRITPACAGKSLSGFLELVTGVGSPPHVRGKVGRTLYLVAGERITPAYAGKSQCNSSCTAGKWDHPRVCGEKPRQDSVGALEGRITPACAGKSLSGFLELVTGVGSPPHVRGKVGRTLYLVAGERITPAYAGKSFL